MEHIQLVNMPMKLTLKTKNLLKKNLTFTLVSDIIVLSGWVKTGARKMKVTNIARSIKKQTNGNDKAFNASIAALSCRYGWKFAFIVAVLVNKNIKRILT